MGCLCCLLRGYTPEWGVCISSFSLEATHLNGVSVLLHFAIGRYNAKAHTLMVAHNNVIVICGQSADI